MVTGKYHIVSNFCILLYYLRDKRESKDFCLPGSDKVFFERVGAGNRLLSGVIIDYVPVYGYFCINALRATVLLIVWSPSLRVPADFFIDLFRSFSREGLNEKFLLAQGIQK